MSKIGYYRFKTNVAKGDTNVDLYVNTVLTSTKVVRSQDFCNGYRTLKYLDSTGQYRFFAFNDFTSLQDNPRKIGSANKFITSILTDQSSERNLGYNNERILNLTADVSSDQLEYLNEIWTSPRVYLYIGHFPNDTSKEWLEVTIEGDNTVKRRKGNSGLINVQVTLPEWYTIKSS